MTNILMILKTQNLKNDQRVLKEINSLSSFGANVQLFVAKNCNTSQSDFNFLINSINILGGAAPNNILLRIIGVFQFYIMSIIYFLKEKNKINKVWICDPIMFGLVILLKLFSPKIIIVWDHHELPPKWFLDNRVLLYLFKKAYLKSNIVIHANFSRQQYLESLLSLEANKSYILSNYPLVSVSEEENLDDKAEQWMLNNKFIYLQNSLQVNRYGDQVIKAAVDSGYSIFHAGKIDQKYIEKYDLNTEKMYLAGYLNPKQMNRALNKCEFTVILYKQDSLNQIYCDANRLYQAMSLGVYFVIGDNPTMIETVNIKKYKNYFILNDISEINDVIESTKYKINTSNSKSPVSLSWHSYDLVFREIVEL